MSRQARQWFVALLTLILLVGNILPALAAGSTERVAKLVAIKGDVKVKVAGGAKPFKAINNMAVTKGDSLFTGKNSSVQLNLDDGSKIMIGSNAQVMISDLIKNAKGGNQTGVKVQNGQVWSKVKSLSNANDSFKYETPTAVMGIRGTMLFIDASASGSDLWVTEGAVGVAKPESPEQQDALVIANERIESTFATLRGGIIDAKQLVNTFDPEILPTAAQDIIQAVYEIAGPNPPNGIGKGLSNEFLKQVKEFVEEAQKKDPSITVPDDFPQVVEQIIDEIEEQLETKPNPPGVTDENSNIPPIPDHPTTPNNGTTPTTGSSSGGHTTGGSGGGNGGTGGGNGNDGGDGNDGKDDDLVLKEIIIEPATLLLQEGKQAPMTIQAKYTDNTIKNITARASISSANDSIATINQGGVVTAVKAGDTIIHASFEQKQASARVKVIKEVDRIEVTPVLSTIKVGKTVIFKATATMTDQTTQDVTQETNWSVTSPEVFWVYPDGKGKAKSVGVTDVTASFKGKSSSMTITVVEDIERIGISPAESEVTVGKEVELKAYSVAEDGSHKTISGDVIWSSSNEKVAIVDDKGTVEALEKGTTTITALYQKWSATTVVKVNSENSPPKATNIHISGKPEVGSTVTGSYKYTDEEEDKEGSSIVAWYRADDSNGANKTLIAGATTLQYKIKDEDKNKYLSFAVTPVSLDGEKVGEKAESALIGPIINNGDVESISITPLNHTMNVQESIQFQATAKMKDGSTKMLTAGVNWTVGNSMVASISSTGLAQGLDGGSTSVTATYDKWTATATLTVEKVLTNTPPVATNVTISGTADVGQVLVGSFTYSDADHDPAGSHQYKWYRADSAAGTSKTVIPGVTSYHYTVQSEDVGKYLFFEITPVATVGELVGSAKLSTPVGPIGTSLPTVTVVTPAKAIGEHLVVKSSVAGTVYLIYQGHNPGTSPTAQQLENVFTAGHAKKISVSANTDEAIDTIEAPNGMHTLYVVEPGNIVSAPTTVELKYGYRIFGDIILDGHDPEDITISIDGEGKYYEADYGTNPILGDSFLYSYKNHPLEPGKGFYYFDVPQGIYKLTYTSSTTIKEQTIETTASQASVTDFTHNDLVEQQALDVSFASDNTPPNLTSQIVTDTLTPNQSVFMEFTEELTAESFSLIAEALKTAVSGISGDNLSISYTTNRVNITNTHPTLSAKFNDNVEVSVQDLAMNTANLRVINVAPRITYVELFDDDGTIGNGSKLYFQFSRDLSETSYERLKDFLNTMSIADSQIRNYDSSGGVIQVSLENTDYISHGDVISIPKESIFDDRNNHPSAATLLVIPSYSSMITSSGLSITSFVDTDPTTKTILGDLTFTRATNETGISKYKVVVQDDYDQIFTQDVTATGLATYQINAITLTSVLIDPKFRITITPYGASGFEGPSVTVPIGPVITGVTTGKTYSTATPNVTGSYTTFSLKKNGSLVAGYTIGTTITEEGTYDLEVADSVGNSAYVRFYIQTYATSITVSLAQGHDYYYVSVQNGISTDEKMFVRMGSPTGFITYGSLLAEPKFDITSTRYYQLAPNQVGSSMMVFITDKEDRIKSWGHVMLYSEFIELPPGRPVAAYPSTSINDSLFTEAELANNDEKVSMMLPSWSNGDPINFEYGDKAVVKLPNLSVESYPYSYITSDHPSSADVDVSDYFNQFGLGRDVVIPTYSVYTIDNLSNSPLSGEYTINSPIKVDTRTLVESDQVVDSDGILNAGDIIQITFTGALDSASKTVMETAFTAMNKFGTGYTIQWVNSNKTVEITLTGDESLEFNQYINLPIAFTAGGVPNPDPVVEIYLTKP